MNEMSTDRYRAITSEARRGKGIWEKIKKDSDYCNKWWLVILPGNSKEIDETVEKHLIRIMEEKYCEKAVVVGAKDSFIIDTKIVYVRLDRDEIDALLRYYRLLQFTENIYVSSVKQPFGCGTIIGKKGITVEDYVRDAVFAKGDRH